MWVKVGQRTGNPGIMEYGNHGIQESLNPGIVESGNPGIGETRNRKMVSGNHAAQIPFLKDLYK